jgi:trehalose 6-phosphate synthase/phosphatase
MPLFDNAYTFMIIEKYYSSCNLSERNFALKPLPMHNKLIIVSNRLPFKIERKNGRLEIRQSSGGLVSAMDSAIRSAGKCIWVGAADFDEELWREYLAQDGRSRIAIRPIFIEKKVQKNYYQGFSNSVIWPLFHYFPSYAVYNEEYYSAYVKANEMFFKEVSSIIEEGDTVWVHDYQLMLLPRYLKEQHRNIALGFFLHIPFPSYEILKHLPEEWRNNILKSLLHADVIGFHTKEYVSHFERSLSYFLGIQTDNGVAGYNDNTALIKAFPIGIDFGKFNSAFNDTAVAEGRSLIKKRYNGVKLIFSVDRLDYTKGVVNRLEAFGKLLEANPHLHEKVTFIINVVPSREKHGRYSERRKLIEEMISHVNGIYGNFHWTPIIYQYGHLTFTELMAFYTACDIALVTPLRDGMNLVAKEFVASRKDRKGVLILSEFAGAANELREAIHVNPNDIELMKSAMVTALSYPAEDQAHTMKTMQDTLQAHDVINWCSEFLNSLRRNATTNKNATIRVMNFEEKIQLVEKYKAARKRLILLDYDGTLVPFSGDPQLAHPDQRIRGLLLRLAADPRNKIIIISGRDTGTLHKWFSDVPVDLVAEHGAFYKNAGCEFWSNPEFGSGSWISGVKDILSRHTAEIKGSFLEEKVHSVTWHYRNAELPDEESTVQAICRELVIFNALDQFNIVCGNKIVEARTSKADKGIFVRGCIKEAGYDLVMAFGDDQTDEDMFAQLTEDHHVSIKVGLKNTKARYNVIGVSNVYSLLDQLSGLNQFTIDISKAAG